MFYKITFKFEDGTTKNYEVKGLMEVLKMVERVKASSNICFRKNKMVDYKIEESEG